MSKVKTTTETTKTISKPKTATKATVKANSLPLTPEAIKTLFDSNPSLFGLIHPKNDLLQKDVITKYDTDPFERFNKVLISDLNLQQSFIPHSQGSQEIIVLDNTSRQIAREQCLILGVTKGELYRHAIWAYFETLTKS